MCAGWRSIGQTFDRGYPRRKVALPTYPFQRQRYWLEAPKKVRRAAAQVRPLVDKVTRLPLHGETVYEALFSVEALPFLADHRVHDTLIAPGACQLAMALNAAELELGEHEWLRLEDIVLPQALVVPDAQARTVQAVYSAAQVPEGAADTGQGSSARQKFNIVSFLVRNGAVTGDTVGAAEDPLGLDLATHATGYVAGYAAGGKDNWARAADLQMLQRRCHQVVDVNTFYADSAAAQIELGPSFRWLAEAWRGQDGAAPEALARLACPLELGDTTGYVLHPGLLDACFQVAGLTEEANQETLLPFAVESLAVRRGVAGSEWWCHAVRTAQHRWNIRLLAQDGEVIAAVQGFQVRGRIGRGGARP